METKPSVRHGCHERSGVLKELNLNTIHNHRIARTVKVEPENNNPSQSRTKEELDRLSPTLLKKDEPGESCDNRLNGTFVNHDQVHQTVSSKQSYAIGCSENITVESNMKSESSELKEQPASPKKCDMKLSNEFLKNKRFKFDLSEATTSKESNSLCYVKSEESKPLCGNDDPLCNVKSEDLDILCLDELKHKPAYSRIPMKTLGRPKTRKDILREVEEYFYLESKYLHFSESGEKFACILCPMEYSYHGKMMSHLLSKNHMNTMWRSSQTSVSIINKIEVLSQLVKYMRSGWFSVFGKYNPLSIFEACQKMESLLHSLVKKGSPCCPNKLQHSWFLCDCIIDTAAEDGKIQSYKQRQKVDLIKSDEPLGSSLTVNKLEKKVKNVLTLDSKVITKVETDAA
ncbi:Elongation factor G [Frankliniella fusca]|uniref:Elongation factor G n=1 Tax=Frankliniella fusca TaxID=407009 RepID=A0AAE1HVD8_9NEOP|nr:Elongation factor G [Frankliniella fusca]